LDQEQRIEETLRRYREYVNAPLANLLRFAGLAHIEEHAEGCTVYDGEGNAYLDLLGGYGVFSLGHRHPAVVDAVKRQLDRMSLSAKIFLNEQMAELCELLAEVTPGDLQCSFICNSGTEAIEGALKIARMATRRPRFVAARGAFHGKSIGSLSASGRDVFKKPFEPLVSGFTHVEFGDAAAVAEAVDGDTAGVLIEPIQGEGGVKIPPDEYLPRLREICDRSGALLIADEVQTGFGRTGRMFGVDHAGVVPDIMTFAKALGGGVMPIGAITSTKDVWDKVFGENPLIHTTTFGGNPLACAAAIAAVTTIRDQALPAKAARSGERFMAGLAAIRAKYPETIADVRGRGLLIGIEFAHQDVGEIVIFGMVQRGVIAAYTLNNPKVIRIEPPLIITDDEIDRALSVIDEAVVGAIDLLRGVEPEGGE
jgi:putrescine aminotransferase